MKKYNSTLFFLLIGFSLFGQKVIEKNFEYQDRYIEMNVKFASNIEVKTWDKNTIYFKANISTKGNKHLDLYDIDIIENQGAITITSNPKAIFKAFYDEWNKNNNPDKKSYWYNYKDKAYEFNYVLYVPKDANFRVSSINGDMTSEIIDGNLEADLVNGNIDIKQYSGALDLSTVNGKIDIKVVNADLVAKTVYGNIYADNDSKFIKSDQFVGQKVQLNNVNASSSLRMKTINGDMYLRL